MHESLRRRIADLRASLPRLNSLAHLTDDQLVRAIAELQRPEPDYAVLAGLGMPPYATVDPRTLTDGELVQLILALGGDLSGEGADCHEGLATPY